MMKVKQNSKKIVRLLCELEQIEEKRHTLLRELEAEKRRHYELAKVPRWRKTRKITEQILQKSREWQEAADQLCVIGKEIQDLAIDAFNTAPAKDTGFVDCLLSPPRIQNEFKNYLFKVSGWSFAANSIKNQLQMPVFTDQMKEACAWVLKLEKVSAVDADHLRGEWGE